MNADTRLTTPKVTLSHLEETLFTKLTNDLVNQIPFRAGGLAQCYSQWERLTSDSNVLHNVRGFTFDFIDRPYQTILPNQLITSNEEITIAQDLLQQLALKGVIEEIHAFDPTGYVSNIFLRQKQSGAYRLILNLKNLNEHVEYIHFKMDHLPSALALIDPNSFFTSIDLSDAYYSVNVAQHHRKYMQFKFNDKLFRFTGLANGVSSAPRLFTKLMKVPLSHLRQRHGIVITAYLDDLLLIADSPMAVLKATEITQKLLTSLGFTISLAKSVIYPSHKITFLGFDLNSTFMLVSVPNNKAQNILEMLDSVLSQSHMPIRQFASILGKLAATLQGNRYGQLFLKYLEVSKTRALRQEQGYEGTISITPSMYKELEWWKANIETVSRPIIQPNPHHVIYTDASLKGWGCHIPATNLKFGGRWDMEDSKQDINFLELKAILLSLQSWAKTLKNCHIQIRSDNTTAVVGINRQGSTHSLNCNSVTREIWMWALHRNLWLSAAHCPGIYNIHADEASRLFNDSTEWMLSKDIFKDICKKFGMPTIDLFASRLNHQVPVYAAWQPDPGAVIIDCFSVAWQTFDLIYAFPPFSIVGRTLQKIRRECTQAIIVIPHWPSQPWFPLVHNLLTEEPFVIPVSRQSLVLPHEPQTLHPLRGQLQLWACRLSGGSTIARATPTQRLR